MTAVYSTASSGSYDPGRHGAIYAFDPYTTCYNRSSDPSGARWCRSHRSMRRRTIAGRSFECPRPRSPRSAACREATFRSARRRHELGLDASCGLEAKTTPEPEEHEKLKGSLRVSVDFLWRESRDAQRGPEGCGRGGRSDEVSRAPSCQTVRSTCGLEIRAGSTRAQSSGTSVGLGAGVSGCFCCSLTD